MSISEPAKIITPWASTGSKNPIPANANNTTGAAGFDKGFPDITMTPEEAGGLPPAGQDFNGIFYQITDIIRYMQAGGQPTFSAALSAEIGGYPKGAVIIGEDKTTLWQSQVDDNANNPNTTPSGWKKVDVGLRELLASSSGASQIGTDSGKNAQEILSLSFSVAVNIEDYPDLKSAIAALPVFGGTVYVPIGKFYAGDWTYNTDYMNKPNVSIVGQKAPTWNANASALEGGSVIEGRFNLFADNFSTIDVGYDLGKNVVDLRFGGADTLSPDYPIGGGTWDAFAFAQPNMGTPVPQRKGFYAKNIICLCKRPDTVGHAFLAEGFNGGIIDGAIGIYGIHATVIKAQNVKFGTIQGFMASGEGMIIKSDSYAAGGDIQGDSVLCDRYLPNSTPWYPPGIPSHGLYLAPATANFTGPIQISSVIAKGSARGVDADGMTGVDIQLGKVIVDGFSGGMNRGVSIGESGDFRRISIGQLICNNVVDALYAKRQSEIGDSHVEIGTMQADSVSGTLISAVTSAEVTVHSLSANNVDLAYNFAGASAKIRIGNAVLSSVARIFQVTVDLGPGWSSFGGENSSFFVDLHDYGVRVKGLIKASAGAVALISSLFQQIRPTEALRFIAYKNNGSRSMALIGIDPISGIILDDGVAPAAGDYVSLDGIGWKI